MGLVGTQWEEARSKIGWYMQRPVGKSPVDHPRKLGLDPERHGNFPSGSKECEILKRGIRNIT